MEKSSYEKKLIQFINTKLKPDKKVTATTLLFKEKILESMNILYLIGFVEEHLGRKITDDEMVMSHFESVRSIVNTFTNK